MEEINPTGLEQMLKYIAEYGISITISGIVLVGLSLALYLTFIYFKQKIVRDNLPNEKFIREERNIHNKIDDEECLISSKKILQAQKYLEDNLKEFEDAGFDRASIWQNHNGTRKGKFHYMYYSLIAEAVSKGLRLFGQRDGNTQKINYYMFAEYEQIAAGELPHMSQVEDLGKVARIIAEDVGTKTICIYGISNIHGRVDGLLFLSAVHRKVTVEPNIEKHIQNLRIIFN